MESEKKNTLRHSRPVLVRLLRVCPVVLRTDMRVNWREIEPENLAKKIKTKFEQLELHTQRAIRRYSQFASVVGHRAGTASLAENRSPFEECAVFSALEDF